MPVKIQTHQDSQVYQKAFEAATRLLSCRRDSRKKRRIRSRIKSAAPHDPFVPISRKRRYKAAFISKLSDAEGEAAESQVWIEFALKFGYLSDDQAMPLHQTYDEILRMLVAIINRPDPWLIA